MRTREPGIPKTSCGLILTDLRAQPTPVWVTLFVAGAASAFALLRWLARKTAPEALPGGGGDHSHLLAALVAQLVAIAAALSCATAIGQIPSALDWPAGGYRLRPRTCAVPRSA